MEQQNRTIRNAVRAVIIRDGELLLQKKYSGEYGDRYTLPGGAQETQETLQQALLRECEEEIDCIVEVGPLFHIADFFKEKQNPKPYIRHQVEFLFHCSVPLSYTPRNGCKPDKHQVDVVWMPLAVLPDLPLSPRSLAELFTEDMLSSRPVYLGVID